MLLIIKVIVGILAIFGLICGYIAIFGWIFYAFRNFKDQYYYEKLYQKQLREQLGIKE